MDELRRWISEMPARNLLALLAAAALCSTVYAGLWP